MSTFTKNSITMKGAVAIAALVAGGTLEFTRIAVGDGNIPAGQTAMTMTDLAHRLFDVTINEVYSDSESQATVTGVFDNSQTATGFFYRELGLFAKDPTSGEEILFCYGNAEDQAEWISPAGEESVIEKEVHIVTLVGNATEVKATLKSGIYPTKEQVNAALALKADLDATAADGGRVLASQMRFDASQTLYVDAAASATGADGSESKPFKTIQAAINARYQGAPVIYIKIKAGTYNEDVKTPRAPNTTWRFTREGSGTVSVKTMLIDNAADAYFNGVTMAGPAVSDTPIFFAANTPCVYIDGMTVNGTTNDTGINFSASRGVIKNSQINNCGIALAAIEGSFVNAQSVNGSGNTRGVFADNSIAILTNWGLSATTPFDITNGGAINTDGAASTYPSSQGHLYSLGGFTETAALKTRLLQEFSKLKEGDFKGFQFWNNIVGNFGIFISSQTMHVWMHKTSNDNGGYGVAVFYAHRDAGAAYMHIVNGAFVDDTPKKFADAADIAKYLPLAGGTMSGEIKSNGGQNYPAISHVNSGGQLWLFDKDDQLYKGGFIVRAKGSDGQYHDLEGRADGRLMWDGKHVVRSVNGYEAAETGEVTIPVATATTYGIMKAATDTTVINPDEDEAAITPAVYHDVSDFRHKSTAYKVGDKVECMFNFELFLECTKAGTTGTGALDTRSVKHGEVITDGTVQWTVRTHIRSVNNTVADANGNITIDIDSDAFKEWGLGTGLNESPEFDNIWTSGDMNDCDKTGFYTLAGPIKNSPLGAEAKTLVGQLIHFHRRYAAGAIALQLCVLQDGELYRRIKVGSNWSEWEKISHDNNLVHTTGDETIDGKKTFNSCVKLKGGGFATVTNSDMDGSTVLDVTQFSHLDFFDKNGIRLGMIQLSDRNDGRLEFEVCVTNGDSTTVKDARIKVGYDKTTKKFYTSAPNPETGSNNNNIATTYFVQALIDALNSEVVHLGGSETITGKKSIKNDIALIRAVNKGDKSVISHRQIQWVDENGNSMGVISLRTGTDGSTRLELFAYKNASDSEDAAHAYLEMTESGVTRMIVPSPQDDASGNEATTAAWTRMFGGRYWGLGSTIGDGANFHALWTSRNLNDCNRTGFYTLSGNYTNSPYGEGEFSVTGQLLHFQRVYGAGAVCYQICIIQNGNVYQRVQVGGSSGAWGAWEQIATREWAVGKEGNRGNLAGYETPVVQSTALTITNTSRDSNLVTGAVKITVNNGAANQAWTKTVALTNASATVTLGSNWKWLGGNVPDVSANCVLVLHWCSTFGIANIIATS